MKVSLEKLSKYGVTYLLANGGIWLIGKKNGCFMLLLICLNKSLLIVYENTFKLI